MLMFCQSKVGLMKQKLNRPFILCVPCMFHRIKTLFVRHWEKKVCGGSVGHVCLSFIILLATQLLLDEESMKMRRKKTKQESGWSKTKVKRLKFNHNYIIFISPAFDFGLCSIY